MTEPLRIVFAGTPDFSVPCLQALLNAGQQVVAVYTQPDRPAGRGRELQPSAVKRCALAAQIPVIHPLTLRDAQAQQALAELQADLMVVVAYGLILPQMVLDTPRYGCWNVHASLLPRWRGAAPIQRAIEAGDSQTGVCLMQMEAGLDTGPVIACQSTPITADDTGGSLHDRLAGMGSELLVEWVAHLTRHGAPPSQAQDDSQACYANKLLKSEARLDLSRPAAELARRVRAFNPWPVAQCQIAGEWVRVWAAKAVNGSESSDPGELVAAGAQGLDLATGTGLLRITELQRPGGRRIAAADYLNARQELRSVSPSSPPDSP